MQKIFLPDGVMMCGSEEPFHEPVIVAIPDWKVIASFWVDGEPKGQPRVKFARMGNFVRTYTPTDGSTQTWKELLIFFAKQNAPKDRFEGPVRVYITAYFSRPAYLDKDCFPDEPFEMPKKPDRDNVEKMVLDVMTNLAYWKDDGQVCGGEVRKLYVGRGGYNGPGRKPGAQITVEINQCWPYKQQRPRSKPSHSKPAQEVCHEELTE